LPAFPDQDTVSIAIRHWINFRIVCFFSQSFSPECDEMRSSEGSEPFPTAVVPKSTAAFADAPLAAKERATAAAAGNGFLSLGTHESPCGIQDFRRVSLIRQAISCDICGSEKQQTNHWFVAHEQGDELRVTGWNSRNRLRPGCKHLCGQTCLHKLVDEFVARTLSARGPIAAEEATVDRTPAAAASLPSEFDQAIATICLEPAAPVTPSVPKPMPKAVPKPVPVRLPPELIRTSQRPSEERVFPEEPPHYASPNWRAEAWERERERELRTERPTRRRFTG
jgi:hypothetical protein